MNVVFYGKKVPFKPNNQSTSQITPVKTVFPTLDDITDQPSQHTYMDLSYPTNTSGSIALPINHESSIDTSFNCHLPSSHTAHTSPNITTSIFPEGTPSHIPVPITISHPISPHLFPLNLSITTTPFYPLNNLLVPPI